MENILDYCTISGESVKKYEGTKKYVATGDVIENKIINSSEVDYMNKPSRANQIAKEGDVIFAKMKDTKKVMKIDKENSEYIYSTGFYIIKPNEGILTDYMYWLFNSTKFNRDKDKHCKGATQKALNSEGLRKIKINKIPNLEEQQKIVSKLSKIDKIMNKKKKQLMMLDELIKSQFVEMFENNKFKKKNLGDIATKITDGSHNPPKGVDERTEYLMLSSQNIIEDRINYNNARYLSREDFERENKRTYLEKGDVLLTVVGTIGRTAIIHNENNITLQRSVAVIKPIEEIKSEYLAISLKSDDILKQLNKGSKGVAQKGIYLNDLKKILIPFPPITLQNEFSEIVKQIDKQKFESMIQLKMIEKIYNIINDRSRYV